MPQTRNAICIERIHVTHRNESYHLYFNVIMISSNVRLAQISRHHSNKYISSNVVETYHACEIIITCEITYKFIITMTEFPKVTLVLASCNQCVVHTKVDFSKFGRHVCRADVTPVQDMKSLLILLMRIES